MIDAHCHLNFHAFEKECDEVIKRAAKKGVKTIINVGTQINSSQKAVELADKYKNLYAIVGVHPHHADKIKLGSDWIEKLETLARLPKTVAIGEIGMDFYNYQSNGVTDPKVQKEIFINQIELAHKLKIPIQIHNRHAGNDILDILINYKSYLPDPPGMFHCMSGSLTFLKKVLNIGFYVGFDGNITYKGKAPGEDTFLSELVSYAPLERILVETDSPFLTPEPFRGSRNEPSYAIIVGEAIAEIKSLAFDQVAQTTTENAEKIFRFQSRKYDLRL